MIRQKGLEGSNVDLGIFDAEQKKETLDFMEKQLVERPAFAQVSIQKEQYSSTMQDTVNIGSARNSSPLVGQRRMENNNKPRPATQGPSTQTNDANSRIRGWF